MLGVLFRPISGMPILIDNIYHGHRTPAFE